MKIVVIGGSGRIGTLVVQELTERGHEVDDASPSTGVNAVTGQGLSDALEGAGVVVDVSNSPSFEDADVLAFFETSGRNLAQAEQAARVRHHVALSVVGSERLPDSGYLRAKVAQENIIKNSGVPYTIVRATQFFEFLGAIAASGDDGEVIRLPGALFQPIAAVEVARAVAEAALAPPLNATTEVAGPERMPMSEAIEHYLAALGHPRTVIADPSVPYFGTRLDDQSLVATTGAHLRRTRLDDWIRTSAANK